MHSPPVLRVDAGIIPHDGPSLCSVPTKCSFNGYIVTIVTSAFCTGYDLGMPSMPPSAPGAVPIYLWAVACATVVVGYNSPYGGGHSRLSQEVAVTDGTPAPGQTLRRATIASLMGRSDEASAQVLVGPKPFPGRLEQHVVIDCPLSLEGIEELINISTDPKSVNIMQRTRLPVHPTTSSIWPSFCLRPAGSDWFRNVTITDVKSRDASCLLTSPAERVHS